MKVVSFSVYFSVVHGMKVRTDGRSGGWLLCRSGKRHDFRAEPVGQIADPTGAGDVFFAAYLTYHLYEGADIDEKILGDSTYWSVTDDDGDDVVDGMEPPVESGMS